MNPNRIKIYADEKRRRTVNFIAIFAIIGAVISLFFAAFGPGKDAICIHAAVYAFWVIGPPLWFFFEYFYFFDNWHNPKAVDEFKYVEGLTSKCWASVLIILTIIYKHREIFNL